MFYERKDYVPTGVQIRGARAMLGLTQEQCAQGSGIALSALKKYESLEKNKFPLAHLRYQTISRLIEFYESHRLRFYGDNESISIKIENSP